MDTNHSDSNQSIKEIQNLFTTPTFTWEEHKVPPNSLKQGMSLNDMHSFISENSFCMDSSPIFDEIPDFNNISQIISISHELKVALKGTIKSFKDASQELISNSIINSSKTSLLLSELETVKKALRDANEESKRQEMKNEDSYTSEENKDGNQLQNILYQIQDIQFQLKSASDSLEESEKLIQRTENENFMLKSKLENLEKSLNTLITEENERHKSSCNCLII